MDRLAARVLSGERLTREDGRWLFAHGNLLEIGALADEVRRAKHGDESVTYVIGRNINYTNVCWVRCRFCAFYRPPGAADGYVLSDEVIFSKIHDLVKAGGTEVLMQGGLNPALPLEYFEDLFRKIKARFPIHLHSLSAPEILYLAHRARVSLEEAIGRLRAAGLDSIPGAGAEILVDGVRQHIAKRKETSAQWFAVHETAHRLGMNTTATMMYGSVETEDEQLEHLLRIRESQDRALSLGNAGGKYTAFIPWSFQPHGTELQSSGEWQGRFATASDYLRIVAVARLMLDNMDHLQGSWVTQGPKIAQVALRYGADDLGSTMMEENVVRAAGTQFSLAASDLEHLIREAGFEPRVRDTMYRLLPRPEEAGAEPWTPALQSTGPGAERNS